MKANMSRQFGSGGILASLLLSLTLSGCGGTGSDGEGESDIAAKGPQFSIDIEAFCGDPVAVEKDMDGNVLNTFNQNVAVRLTDVSDDNGPDGAAVGVVTVNCTAAVKLSRGKSDQVNFGTIELPDPGFGVIDATCPLGNLPNGATEWKATAAASGGDVRRDVSDTCEEIAAP